MLKSLVNVREALATNVVLNSWKEWMKGGDENTKNLGDFVIETIGSDEFWNEVDNILPIIKPI